jgi:TrmH family RNA methyltransferase
VLLSREYRDDTTDRRQRLLEDLSRAGCRVHVVPGEIVASLTGGRSIGAIVGLVRFPESRSLAGVLGSEQGSRPVLLVAVDVEDPGNVGALTRTALASGAAALVGIGISDPFHPRAVRISMGSVFKLPILLYPNLDDFLQDLRPHDCMTVGAVSTGGTPLARARFGQRAVALLMGSEASGLSTDMTKAVDARVTVPMAAGVDSFSVNAAAAVILYEVQRGE